MHRRAPGLEAIMRRRDFIKVVAGSAITWPLAARAQPSGMRRFGFVTGLAETDPFAIGYVQALRGSLEKLGWIEGRNFQFIYRYAAGDPALARTYAKELVGM